MSGIDSTPDSRTLFAEHALLPTGWAQDVRCDKRLLRVVDAVRRVHAAPS